MLSTPLGFFILMIVSGLVTAGGWFLRKFAFAHYAKKAKAAGQSTWMLELPKPIVITYWATIIIGVVGFILVMAFFPTR